MQQHTQRVLTSYHQQEAERRAATGNPAPGIAGPGGQPKKPKFDSPGDLKKRLAEHKAKLAEQQANGGSSGGGTPLGAGQVQPPTNSQSPNLFVSYTRHLQLQLDSHHIASWTPPISCLPTVVQRSFRRHALHPTSVLQSSFSTSTLFPATAIRISSSFELLATSLSKPTTIRWSALCATSHAQRPSPFPTRAAIPTRATFQRVSSLFWSQFASAAFPTATPYASTHSHTSAARQCSRTTT